MQVVSKYAKGTFANGRRMISIPIPPRGSYVSPAKQAVKKFKEIVTISRDSTAEAGVEALRQQRRDTKRKTILLSLLINLSICIFLSIIVSVSGDEIGEQNTFIIASHLSENETSNSSSGSSGSPEKLSSPEKKNVSPVSSTIQNFIAPASEFPEIEISTFEIATDPSLQGFSPSMSSRDLRKLKQSSWTSKNPFAKAKPNGKRTGTGTGSGNGFDSSPNSANGFFEGKFPGGDGSNLVLFLDISGSMKKRSEAVGRYVELNYPKAAIVEVQGCAMGNEKAALLRAIMSSKELKTRSHLVFVCDLQDPVSGKGIMAMRSLILQPESRKAFHIISFDRVPSMPLYGLIKESGGSFKKAY